MHQRAAAPAEVQPRLQRPDNIILRVNYRVLEDVALRKIRGNRGRQRAARSVGVGIVDSFSFKPDISAVTVKKIVRVIYQMAAF